MKSGTTVTRNLIEKRLVLIVIKIRRWILYALSGADTLDLKSRVAVASVADWSSVPTAWERGSCRRTLACGALGVPQNIGDIGQIQHMHYMGDIGQKQPLEA